MSLTAKIIIHFAKDSVSADGDSVGPFDGIFIPDPLRLTGPTDCCLIQIIELIFQYLTFVVCGISLVNSFLVQLRQSSELMCPLIDWWLRLYKLKSHLFLLCQWASVLTSCLMLDSGFQPDDFLFKLSIFNLKFRPFGSDRETLKYLKKIDLELKVSYWIPAAETL
jgi:hypothetical protein